MSGVVSTSALDELKAYTDSAVRGAKQDLKVWLMGTVIVFMLSVVVPMGGIVFYLGKISNKLDGTFAAQVEQGAIIAERREWMNRRERTEENLVEWAKTKGYVPPSPVQ